MFRVDQSVNVGLVLSHNRVLVHDGDLLEVTKNWMKIVRINACCTQTSFWVWIAKKCIIWSFSFRFKILTVNKTSRPDTRFIYFPMTSARKNIMGDYIFQILDIFPAACFSFLNNRSLTEQFLKKCEEWKWNVIQNSTVASFDGWLWTT